jgi:hypothetical protein
MPLACLASKGTGGLRASRLGGIMLLICTKT